MNSESFGELIRASRRRLNKSLQEVATALGVTAVYVSEVERRKRPPLTMERLPALSHVLELDLKTLIATAWTEKKMIELDPSVSDKQVQALVALARGGLSDTQLTQILEIATKEQKEMF